MAYHGYLRRFYSQVTRQLEHVQWIPSSFLWQFCWCSPVRSKLQWRSSPCIGRARLGAQQQLPHCYATTCASFRRAPCTSPLRFRQRRGPNERPLMIFDVFWCLSCQWKYMKTASQHISTMIFQSKMISQLVLHPNCCKMSDSSLWGWEIPWKKSQDFCTEPTEPRWGSRSAKEFLGWRN